ncbi:MAG: hypothetical protein ACI9QC_000069 [Oceanicoccus sp.]|jgi:hypothetical protein
MLLIRSFPKNMSIIKPLPELTIEATNEFIHDLELIDGDEYARALELAQAADRIVQRVGIVYLY